VIEVGNEYDVFVIDAFVTFETLNDRGLELAVADLVKTVCSFLPAHGLRFSRKRGVKSRC
jgi:hypothetical protein